ncbi:MAG: helix-turn-helix domain-containing protein [Gemmatimonadota bacterium]
MEKKKHERLERAGWRIGSPEEFLGLSEDESRYIELKLALSEGVRMQRANAGLSQEELAKRLGSSQSRVSKVEKGDPTVSVDLLVRSMFAAGATRQDLAATIGSKHRKGQ